MPGVQNPHCTPPASTRACCTSLGWAVDPNPAAVVTSQSSTSAASTVHAVTRAPSSSTEHDPHRPWAQPSLAAVSPALCRNASSRLTCESGSTTTSAPSTLMP